MVDDNKSSAMHNKKRSRAWSILNCEQVPKPWGLVSAESGLLILDSKGKRAPNFLFVVKRTRALAFPDAPPESVKRDEDILSPVRELKLI